MKKIFSLKLFLVVILLFTSKSAATQELNQSHTAKNFGIQYPEGWSVDTSGQMNTEFILFSPVLENDTFSENVNLLIQDLSGQNITMKSYVEISENQVTNMIPNSKIFESHAVKSKKPPYHLMVWSGNVANQDLKFKQYFYLINNKAYILTFSASINDFDKYSKIGTKILDSFKFN